MRVRAFGGLVLAALWALPQLAMGQGGLGGALKNRTGALGALSQAGGQVEVLARDQYFDEETSTFVFDGDVHARQAGVFDLKAQRVVYYKATGWIQAEDDVQLTLGGDVMSGDTATYNLHTGRAKVQNVHAVLSPSLILEAESIEKLSPHPRTGESRFFIVQGTFTSCHRPGTGWNLKARQALIHMDNFIHLYGVVFRARGIPLFYLPYFAQSIKRGRTTGFLPPRTGYDNTFGIFTILEFFWAITDWADLSVAGADFGTNRADGTVTLRFILSPKDQINTIVFNFVKMFNERLKALYGSSIRTFQAKLDHTFPYKIQTRANAVLQSSVLTDDPAVDPRLRTRRFNRAEATAARVWGSQSLRVLGSYTQGVGTAGSAASGSLILKVPSIAYSSFAPWNIIGKALQVLIPTATLENIRRRDVPLGQAQELDLSVWRMQFVPRVQGTLTLPGISIQPSLSLVETWYSKRKVLDPNFPLGSFGTFNVQPQLRDSGPGGFIGHAGDGLYRHLYNARVDMVGPSFYRIYDTDLKTESKLKHLIQPSFIYQYSPFVDESEVFDTGEPAIDRIGTTSHSLTYALTNVLLYKKRGQPSANEVLRLEAFQSYFLIDEAELQRANPFALGLKKLGDLNFRLVATPSASTRAEAAVQLESIGWRPRGISVDFTTGHRRWSVHGRYARTAFFKLNPAGSGELLFEPLQHSASLDTTLRLTHRWNFQARGVYNILDRSLSDSHLELGYGAQCWGLTISGGLLERRPLGPMTPIERHFSVGFSIHLKNLGSLGTSQRLS